jgi:putative OPT family oligopeptide transporter
MATTQQPPIHEPPAPPALDAGTTLDRVPLAADEAEFRPYVPERTDLPELTPGAVLLGMGLGLVFAASSVYLALKIGLTVSASIPIAVLSITIFRWISGVIGARPSILRNNIVQTTGSAGESIAAGTVFTLPGLILLGYELPASQVAAIALVGGLLGVLLMIPLRRSLIVKEHRSLKYPEGTACAEVLIVGEERGVQAKTVFMGFGLGALYKFLNNGAHAWAEVPGRVFQRVVPGNRPELYGEVRAEISPELTGVGYIIGPRISGYLFAGGVLSFFVLIPAIKFFGDGLATPIAPGTTLIRDMDAMAVRANYVYYIGAGAVTAAGLISLVRALPTIWAAIVGSFAGLRKRPSMNQGPTDTEDTTRRTQRDLPMPIVLGGVALLAVAMVLLPQININPLGAILAVFFSFLFVTVSSRITGQIGASANPISGMTVATVLMTALIFLAIGWTGVEHRVLALSIGGVVCIAAAVAGATSQDLKTGYLVGATPARQQIGLVAGVCTSALLIGFMIQFLNEAKTTIVRREYAGVAVPAANFEQETRTVEGRTYRVGHLYEQSGAAPAGRYLVDESGAIRFLLDPGIGGREPTDYQGRTIEKLDSPKAQIMALVVDGILTQKLSWGLILIGAFFAIAMEVLGLPSLPVAVGVYLPISTSATIFMGGIIRWLIDRRLTPAQRAGPDADSGPGVLFSSGLIAGGAIMGVALAALTVYKVDRLYNLGPALGAFAQSPLAAMVIYLAALAVPLYLVARRGSSASH